MGFLAVAFAKAIAAVVTEKALAKMSEVNLDKLAKSPKNDLEQQMAYEVKAALRNRERNGR